MDATIDLVALRDLSYGVYIVSSFLDGKLNGQIANTVFQVSAEPSTIAISINKLNLTHEYIEKSGYFSVAVVEEEATLKYIGIFGFRSGRDIDKFTQVEHKIGSTGCPIPLEYVLSSFEARVVGKIDASTHTVFIGEIVSAEVIKHGTPLTYLNYHELKKGKSPKTAPTYNLYSENTNK
jgi:ferric-chelate reductase [NAD(P)H]